MMDTARYAEALDAAQQTLDTANLTANPVIRERLLFETIELLANVVRMLVVDLHDLTHLVVDLHDLTHKE